MASWISVWVICHCIYMGSWPPIISLTFSFPFSLKISLSPHFHQANFIELILVWELVIKIGESQLPGLVIYALEERKGKTVKGHLVKLKWLTAMPVCRSFWGRDGAAHVLSLYEALEWIPSTTKRQTRIKQMESISSGLWDHLTVVYKILMIGSPVTWHMWSSITMIIPWRYWLMFVQSCVVNYTCPPRCIKVPKFLSLPVSNTGSRWHIWGY